jgi:NodT family efflux transporter outer membrane factor (OMF) lipoprotein
MKLSLRSLLCAICAACAGLGACSFMPRYVPPANPAPPKYKEIGEWQTAQPADRGPRGDWWQEYGDARLDALEAQIDTANPDLAAAADRYQQAHALALEARSYLLPNIGVQGYMNTDRQSADRPLRSANQPDSYHDDLLGATLNYELDLWGRVRSAATAGAAAAQAAFADVESVRLALHAELANDYIALRAADAERTLLEQTVQAYNRAFDMTRDRLEGGVSSGLDVAQAETQLESARASLTDVTASRALYQHAIATLTGAIASTFTLEPGELDLAVPAVPVTLPATLLQRRPDVAAAERRMAEFNAGIGVARAAFFPRISIAAVAGFQSTQSAGLLTAPNRFWAVGPQGTLTLFDAGFRRAVVANARAQFEEATNHYRSVVLRSFQDVEDQLALSNLLQQELKQQDAARVAAERALSLSLNRYQEGAVSYLQVVNAQVTALQTQRSVLALRARQLQTNVNLVRALGGGWSADWPVTADVTVAPISEATPSLRH